MHRVLRHAAGSRSRHERRRAALGALRANLMTRVLVLGAGKIGRMIARLLLDSGDYGVVVGDSSAAALERISRRVGVDTTAIDVLSSAQLHDAIGRCDAVISALSFFHNIRVAEAALAAGVSYFDLTEDVTTTRHVRDVAARARDGQIFMPQCGLAPGFISIVAQDLTRRFEKLDAVRMRVGALPLFPTGTLKYNLTWSTDGLINEYCNPCEAIHDGSSSKGTSSSCSTASSTKRSTRAAGWGRCATRSTGAFAN